MTDGIAWLAAPRSIAYGGYSVLLTCGLDEEELVSRLAGAVCSGRRTLRSLGELTGEDLIEALEDEYGDHPTEAALRLGRDGDRVFAVMYGGWQDEFGSLASVSRGGAHVFHLEFEEENGKPVPPWFHYFHDERLLCGFNLHLDHSWGSAGVDGDPEVAPQVERLLGEAGLPDENLPAEDAHRTSLQVVERHFGLSLPRSRVLEEPLPSVVLEIA
ncbi:hypothetical protein GCM10010497_29090 [Streptomyces cinereoruber]|uniref:Uncharacterized protein n=1 Tax=Streptomyces cinereoruber TaxID=67260 RepID=A0AAV4KJP0_9ACTN|nr:hypothetical protein [Streptomyces cinereoruber]MBB4155995.1 hypothetical protein [Streptomyces cinereoruber]MBY8816887.1 hypothetical protein [Streptomyces cinereoruber]NIH64806.1 hypothetical protein [Streptomyces cinereoruber]GGR25248.1 hypothetical protein GCM10010497_29090 [Streptomyces cinereoruber]